MKNYFEIERNYDNDTITVYGSKLNDALDALQGKATYIVAHNEGKDLSFKYNGQYFLTNDSGELYLQNETDLYVGSFVAFAAKYL